MCERFKLASLSDRVQFVTTNKLCQLCLNKHPNKCKFIFKCSFCKEKHNSLLHQDNPEKVIKQVALSINKCDDVLLPTIKVKLIDKNGHEFYVKALCDSGSQLSFVLSDLTDKINCNLTDEHMSISGICDDKNKINQKASFQIYSINNNSKLDISCCVVPKITCDLPQFKIDANSINMPSHIKLADPDFYKCDKISLLLGCDLFFQILLRDKLPLTAGLCLHNTLFGYVVAGKVSESSASSLCSNTVSINNDEQVIQSKNENDSLDSLEINMQNFWKCEQVSEIYKEAASDQELAESIFTESMVLEDGRFQVDLPLKQNLDQLKLGDSLSRAIQRFHNLEKRFAKDPVLFQKYKAFIEEYLSLGHAEYVDIEIYDLESGQIYFLPHHPVMNENSSTTKLRVVFDGSMFTNLGISLNDVLLNGPCVQNELFNILILFRLHKYVFVTDIQKMFRQVKLNKAHCQLQNILWRDSPQEGLKCIQLQTVTYGLKSSTFLATRCLVELAHRYKDLYPLGASILINNTYIDDANVGSNDIDSLIEMKKQLIELLKLGGFTLHKWSSNDKKVLNDIPSESKQFTEIDLCKDENQCVKTLGVSYNIHSDTLKLTSPQQVLLETYTKRQALSFISKMFDPLGLVGPIIVLAKIIMQLTWLAKVSWDSPLPSELNKMFIKFAQNLNDMKPIIIKRNTDTSNAQVIELVGFSDASNKAYGCCVYLRVIDKEGNVKVNLLCSKSRINPIKPLSTPRLELNSALLLAKLVKKIYDQMINAGFKLKVHLYVDSQIVLSWLNTAPAKLGVYVANRVKAICELTETFSWSYVNTMENPADCLSRGVDAHLLVNVDLWWHGPQFLQNADWAHSSENTTILTDIPEMKVCNVVTTPSNETFKFLSKYSDINKMKRVLAFIYRFINNCKVKKEKRESGYLTCKELNFALNMIIKHDQNEHFADEIRDLLSNKPIKSNLKSLNPFIDGMGILRVGGRLQNAAIPYQQRHPAILPKKSVITHLIIHNEHRCLLHASQKLLLASLHQRYYLINGIREIKHVIYKCVTCFKLKAKASHQLMGSLPSDRVNPSRPFEKVGIDFGGPFSIKLHRVRKPLILKAYIVLFVCFITKAIHIELVSNMTTECFLQCLKRFISRRNKPSVIYCDNGSTFKGAKNQLKELHSLHSNKKHQDQVGHYASNLGIQFSFIPSYSPVFGGLWEAGIKSAKYHLKRVVGQQILTYEELNSVIIQIEGILNSRPILSLPLVDSNDMSYLTPAHFLTGTSLTSYPEPDLTDVPISRLSFWRQCTQMIQSFWKTWSKQYLTQLQSRPKWHHNVPNIKKDSLVILKMDNTSPLVWPMARVEQVFPGSDSKVRALTVRTSKGTVIRTSVTKVCVLPIN
ncbi:uncharacterized protein LOC126370517 isoform X2 [Pectinophora gossypiella]|nr:uncharacterized protein LOC126370517 isoform X2 [Pectinophora gossypiella]